MGYTGWSSIQGTLVALAHASASIGRRLVMPAFSDSRLPDWLDRHLDWNRASDEALARSAERSHETAPRGKDSTTDW